MMTVLTKWKVALYLLAIFTAGAVSGWVIAAKTAKEKMFTPPRMDEIAKSLRERIHSKIDLTPDQGKRIDAVIEKDSKEIQSIQGECFRRIRQVQNERYKEITAALSPEQRKQFEKMEKERQESWRGHEPWRGKGPPPNWRHGPRDRSRTNNPAVDRSTNAVAPSDVKAEK